MKQNIHPHGGPLKFWRWLLGTTERTFKILFGLTNLLHYENQIQDYHDYQQLKQKKRNLEWSLLTGQMPHTIWYETIDVVVCVLFDLLAIFHVIFIMNKIFKTLKMSPSDIVNVL